MIRGSSPSPRAIERSFVAFEERDWATRFVVTRDCSGPCRFHRRNSQACDYDSLHAILGGCRSVAGPARARRPSQTNLARECFSMYSPASWTERIVSGLRRDVDFDASSKEHDLDQAEESAPGPR